jgi:hypothetical protein
VSVALSFSFCFAFFKNPLHLLLGVVGKDTYGNGCFAATALPPVHDGGGGAG